MKCEDCGITSDHRPLHGRGSGPMWCTPCLIVRAEQLRTIRADHIDELESEKSCSSMLFNENTELKYALEEKNGELNAVNYVLQGTSDALDKACIEREMIREAGNRLQVEGAVLVHSNDSDSIERFQTASNEWSEALRKVVAWGGS